MHKNLGSTPYQVKTALSTLRCTGQSKYNAQKIVMQNIPPELKQELKKLDQLKYYVAQRIGIFSEKTFKAHLNIDIQFANYAKAQFGIKDIKNLTDIHAQAFIQSKIQANVSIKTLQAYISILNKFQTALKNISGGKEYNFNLQGIAKNSGLTLKERSGYHEYQKPNELLNHILNSDKATNIKLAVQLQLATGVRAGKDMNNIHFNGDQVFAITKGGKLLELVNIADQLKQELKAYLASNKLTMFNVSYKAYTNALKAAASATGQKYEGTHGLRHNYALNRLHQLQAQGIATQKAYLQIGKELGHNRIVYAYFR